MPERNPDGYSNEKTALVELILTNESELHDEMLLNIKAKNITTEDAWVTHLQTWLPFTLNRNMLAHWRDDLRDPNVRDVAINEGFIDLTLGFDYLPVSNEISEIESGIKRLMDAYYNAKANPRYKWATPHDWLSDRIDRFTEGELRIALRQLMEKVDGDDIQDIFEPDMEEDNYFVNQSVEEL